MLANCAPIELVQALWALSRRGIRKGAGSGEMSCPTGRSHHGIHRSNQRHAVLRNTICRNRQGRPGAKPDNSQGSSCIAADTVKLSSVAQARMMHRAGQSASLIAATLGTSVAAVDGYLNIKVAAQAAPAQAAAPEQGAEAPAQARLNTQAEPPAAAPGTAATKTDGEPATTGAKS